MMFELSPSGSSALSICKLKETSRTEGMEQSDGNIGIAVQKWIPRRVTLDLYPSHQIIIFYSVPLQPDGWLYYRVNKYRGVKYKCTRAFRLAEG